MKLTLVGSAEPYKNDSSLPNKIYKSDGLKAHVERKHPDCVQYIDMISEIISDPDYIGSSPRESEKSFELVKVVDNNIQIGVKLDNNGEYWYVATLYTITDAKLQHRLDSGRLQTFVP